jgi:hypothetical protein
MANVKKIFPNEWLTIVALAEQGKPVKKIAEQFFVDQSVIYRGLAKRRVNLSVAAHRAQAEEAEINKQDLIKKIKDSKELGYAAVKYIKVELFKIVANENKAAQLENRPPNFGVHLNSVKTLKIALDGLKTGTDDLWRLLGLDKENKDADAILPDLPISVMTDGEVDQMRAEQEAQDGLAPGELEEMLDAARLNKDEVDDEDDSVVEEDDDA